MSKPTATDKIRAALHDRPGQTTAEIALYAGVAKSTAAELLNKWAGEGSVRREHNIRGKAAAWYEVPAAAETAADAAEAMGVDYPSDEQAEAFYSDAPALTADEQAWVAEMGEPVDIDQVAALVAAVEETLDKVDEAAAAVIEAPAPVNAEIDAFLAEFPPPAPVEPAAPTCRCGDDEAGHVHPERKPTRARGRRAGNAAKEDAAWTNLVDAIRAAGPQGVPAFEAYAILERTLPHTAAYLVLKRNLRSGDLLVTVRANKLDKRRYGLPVAAEQAAE